MQQIKTKGYGAKGSMLNGLSLMEFERQAPKDDELLIEILYCGVCHSDVHQVKNDWKNTIYPCVPGHEIIGKIIQAGSSVTRFKTGQIVGVGCMIDSCGSCSSCKEGEENYCEGPVSWTATYNGYLKPKDKEFNTYGGYSENIVVKESFVLGIPESLDIKSAAPILCAGVTTYSPLKHWNITKGDKVGVVGIGGLGHMAIKLAKAMGAKVTAITSSEEKRKEVFDLGANDLIISTDKKVMEAAEFRFYFEYNSR